MNDTIILYEKCDHDELCPHPQAMDEEMIEPWCPGGRERRFRQVPWDYFFDSRDKVWVEVPVLEEKEAEPDAE